jgi:hypothetical protein
MPRYTEDILRDEIIVVENMMVYIEILQPSDTARNPQGRIDNAVDCGKREML